MTARPQFLEWMPREFLAGILMLLTQIAVGSEPIVEIGKKAVLQTANGMILVGEIQQADSESVALQTEYGSIIVPVKQIHRVNGDRLDPDEGIIREHTVVIEEDGDVTLDYLVPASSRPGNTSMNLLLTGKVLQIEDLNGCPLSFVSEERSGYTRCRVEMPDYCLPAVRVRVLQKKALRIEGDRFCYSYRYTPRSNQIFRLQLSLPPGIIDFEATPEVVRGVSDTLAWERNLPRQKTAVFNVSFRLPHTER
ncbi:MAG: hypothetical protein ABIH23_33480 [bacterium]